MPGIPRHYTERWSRVAFFPDMRRRGLVGNGTFLVKWGYRATRIT